MHEHVGRREVVTKEGGRAAVRSRHRDVEHAPRPIERLEEGDVSDKAEQRRLEDVVVCDDTRRRVCHDAGYEQGASGRPEQAVGGPFGLARAANSTNRSCGGAQLWKRAAVGARGCGSEAVERPLAKRGA